MSGIDICFVMDESGSIGAYNYELMKRFVNDTVNEFLIGPDDTQVGVITYASSARYQFFLNTYHDKPSIQMAVRNLVFSSGGTDTAEAIFCGSRGSVWPMEEHQPPKLSLEWVW